MQPSSATWECSQVGRELKFCHVREERVSTRQWLTTEFVLGKEIKSGHKREREGQWKLVEE